MHHDWADAGSERQGIPGGWGACVALGPALLRSLLGTLRHNAEELLAFGQFNNIGKAIPEDALNELLR